MTIYMCVFAVCVTAIIIAYMLITQNSNENSNVNLTFEKKDEPQIYGNEYNCIMTMFGDCSYAETGCGSCKVVEKVRKALEKYEPKTEPQTDTEVAKAIVHNMIDDAVIAEDAYPDLRQKMHDAVDEYEPQTERSE